MIYLKNPDNGEVVAFLSVDSIGAQYATWATPTQLEIDAYNEEQLFIAKQNKVAKLCLDYDNAYVIKMQWTFNGVTDVAILKNSAYPYDNRTYATTRVTNFKTQIQNANNIKSDAAVIATYQANYGRNPVKGDFFQVPLHKYTDNRVAYVEIKQNKANDFATMCDTFLTTISSNYTAGYTPLVYYIHNQKVHAENINALTTIEDVENYTYTIEPLILTVNPSVIENVVYNT